MNSVLPIHRQQKHNTCALACLRMVLAAFGTDVTEGELEAEAHMEPGGTLITELERLAKARGLNAEIREVTTEDLRRILAEGKWPIVYLDRAVFDLTPKERKTHHLREAKIHTAIPARFTPATVVCHDPLFPRITRRTVALFEAAHRALGSPCVVCSKPTED